MKMNILIISTTKTAQPVYAQNCRQEVINNIMVNLTINDKAVSVPEGTTLIDAAKTVGIEIPNLCYLEGVHKFGALPYVRSRS